MHTSRIIRRRIVPEADHLPAHMHPVLRRIYAARNVTSEAELDYSLERLLSYSTLSGVDRAAGLLAEAVRAGKRLMIIADYDADGATACALAVRALKSMGAVSVDFLVPDRFRHGYGLSADIADLAIAEGPDLLITVDNGISSVEGVARASAAGLEVIITDHHLPGAVLPAAGAIVNPNLPGDRFPSKNLAGVGVMFYVLAALRSRLREAGWFAARGIEAPNLAGLLDLVALGTVADMVPLDANNRILVAQGINRMRAGRCVPGIASLLSVANRSRRGVTAGDLAYFAAPRLNAAGRLTDMRLGIRCLLEDNPDGALQMASELDALNRQRREIQAQMQEQALRVLPDLQGSGDDLPPGICIYQDDWHAGVVGVLASQIKERTQRPVIAFAREAEGLLKGSGRSVDGVHIRDVLANIANANPGLLQRYGGHAMAAGLSIAEDRLTVFRELFEREVMKCSSAVRAAAELLSDGDLEGGDLNLETAETIKAGGPWGQAFPEPVFDGEFDVTGARVVGERHVKLGLSRPGFKRPLDAIAFNLANHIDLDGANRLHVAYRLDINEYSGRRTVQLIVEQAERIN